MQFQETIAFYLLIGAGVAGSIWLRSPRTARGGRWFMAITATVFWPLYLPLLLAKPGEPEKPVDDRHTPHDAMTTAIAQVNAELDTAFSSLDGWAENVLVSERGRMAELRAALVAQ